MAFELSFSLLLLFIGSLCFIIYTRNWRRHLILLFCLFLYFIYLFLTPAHYASKNDFTKFSNDFSNFFDSGMWIYVMALFCFLFGYFLTYLIKEKEGDYPIYSPSSQSYLHNSSKFDIVFYAILILNIIALSNKGISINNIINPPENAFEEAKGGFNSYLIFFSDSLITVLISAYLFKAPKRKLIIWIIISFFIFLILGFRYRILLTVIGILIIYLFRNKLEIKKLAFYSIIIMIVIYIVIFITNNRKAFRTLNYSDVNFEWKLEEENDRYLVSDDTPLLYGQTNNFSTDFSVLKVFEMGYAKHDHGESMIVFIFIRLVPSAFFEDGIKPEIPQQKILRECFGSNEGFYAGAAVTNIFEYYIAFGEIGVFLGMFLFGVFLAIVSCSLKMSEELSILKYVIITAVCFQIITRGYTPQTINHLAYMLIPYFIIKKWMRPATPPTINKMSLKDSSVE